MVEVQVVELVLVGLGLGDGVGVPPAQALVALAGDGPELRVVVVARELDEVRFAVDGDLGDDGLQGTVSGASQNTSSPSAAFASPSVWVTPCSEGYWPVRSDARLGPHAAAIA